ncbi:MAG: hypothetical protein ABI396_00820 [Ktedonobacteraceae bacterium]
MNQISRAIIEKQDTMMPGQIGVMKMPEDNGIDLLECSQHLPFVPCLTIRYLTL